MTLLYRSIIWLWSALLVLACAAIVNGTVTIYPHAPRELNVAAAVALLIIAIGFGLRKMWAIIAAVPVVLGTTVIDIMLGLHGGLAIAWPGIVLGLTGWLALAAQYALRKTLGSTIAP
jgi:hypothetical protein